MNYIINSPQVMNSFYFMKKSVEITRSGVEIHENIKSGNDKINPIQIDTKKQPKLYMN